VTWRKGKGNCRYECLLYCIASIGASISSSEATSGRKKGRRDETYNTMYRPQSFQHTEDGSSILAREGGLELESVCIIVLYAVRRRKLRFGQDISFLLYVHIFQRKGNVHSSEAFPLSLEKVPSLYFSFATLLELNVIIILLSCMYVYHPKCPYRDLCASTLAPATLAPPLLRLRHLRLATLAPRDTCACDICASDTCAL
jgi:hypothetical protein